MTERTQKNIEYLLGTFAVEGLRPSEDALHICERMGDGEITLQEALREIERKHGVAGAKGARK